MWKNKKGTAIKAAFLAGTSVASAFSQSVSSYKSMGSSWAAYLLVPFGILSSIVAYSYFSAKKEGVVKKCKEYNVNISSKNEEGNDSGLSTKQESVKRGDKKESTDSEIKNREKIKQQSVPKSLNDLGQVKKPETDGASIYKYLLPTGLFFGIVFILCLFSGKINFKKKDSEKIADDVEDVAVRKSADKYFEAVFGVPEDEFRKKLKNREGFRKEEDGNIIMINSKDNKAYCAGKIEFKNLGSLRGETKNANSKKKGRINILGINKMFGQASEELRSKIDVSCLQVDKKNNGALFLVASNWNTVELLGSYDLVENKKITGAGQNSYFDDGTQAPPARLGTLAGTVACHDLINMEKYPDDPSKWSQTSEGESQVNLLEGLGIRTVNGYIVDDIENIKRVVEDLEKKDSALENKFKICYHANQQVCAKKVSVGAGQKFADFIYDPNQKVDQVYTAAVSLAYQDVFTIAYLNMNGWKDYDKLEGKAKDDARGNRLADFDILGRENADEYKKKFDETKDLLSRLAKQIARLNYEAVIKSAIAKKKEKVYLTLLGCGVFGNEVGWVIDAINNCKNLIEESGLEVIINISDAGLKDKKLYKKLAPLIYNSKGEKVGEFNIFNEQNGKIFNVGEGILNNIKPELVNKKIEFGNGDLIVEGY